jgi:hypothetical protein
MPAPPIRKVVSMASALLTSSTRALSAFTLPFCCGAGAGPLACHAPNSDSICLRISLFWKSPTTMMAALSGR